MASDSGFWLLSAATIDEKTQRVDPIPPTNKDILIPNLFIIEVEKKHPTMIEKYSKDNE